MKDIQLNLFKLGLIVMKNYPDEYEKLSNMELSDIMIMINAEHGTNIYKGMDVDQHMPSIIKQLEINFDNRPIT